MLQIVGDEDRYNNVRLGGRKLAMAVRGRWLAVEGGNDTTTNCRLYDA